MDVDRVQVKLGVEFYLTYLYFHFEFAEGQNTKTIVKTRQNTSKYQHPHEDQNVEISALSTPILMTTATFFSIFKLYQNNKQTRRKTSENARNLRNKSWKSLKMR